MGRRKVVTEHVIDDEDELAEAREASREFAAANEGVTIFDLTGVDERKISKVHVFRKDPPEGFLAATDPGITEGEILSRWGGSEYRIEGKNDKGQVVKVRSLTLAGDPMFVSEIFEVRWRRMNGLKPRKDTDEAPRSEQFSIKDTLLLMEERDSKRREEERERRAQEAIAHEEREERRRKDEAEREERRRKDENEREDRRKREAAEAAERERRQRQEDDDRRRQQHREDMERQQAQTQLMMQQQQAMFTNTVEMMKVEASRKADVDPITVLTKGMELALSIKGDGNGEPQDVMTAIAGRLPEILSEVRQVGGAVVDEIRGKKGGGKAPAANGGGGASKPVVIHGPMAQKIRIIAANLAKQGKDPTKVMDHMLSMALAQQQRQALPGKAKVKKGTKSGGGRKKPRAAAQGTIPIRPATAAAPAAK